MTQKTIGIDGSNIRAGGGLTHLSQLIQHSNQKTQVIVWGGSTLVSKLPEKTWLRKIQVPLLDRSLPVRMIWQQFILPFELKKTQCDVLFSPGGTLPFNCSIPAVTMSQNMLPFESKERARFGLSFMRIKLWLLKFSQSGSFKRAEGLIFLTEYAKQVVLRRYPSIRAETVMIPHGIEERFRAQPKTQDPKRGQSSEFPFKFLYVSIIDVYKHQSKVAEAVASLRKKGISLTVEFVGGAYPPALEVLRKTMIKLDPKGEFLVYRGMVKFEDLHALYRDADGFVFASSCENLPNILIEAMSAGLPIACSKLGPMPEVLKENGVYFDPENAHSIEEALHELVSSPDQRAKWAQGAEQRSRQYSWERCARETFDFISKFG
ncbi:MAG: glycosyltransferase family 4 protein [Xanthomonadaceae bacterium]|nr:glycosyltransferase family 4 protein [Xanthomonadaceae bacterium]